MVKARSVVLYSRVAVAAVRGFILFVFAVRRTVPPLVDCEFPITYMEIDTNRV
jgi:hypothetical protein